MKAPRFTLIPLGVAFAFIVLILLSIMVQGCAANKLMCPTQDTIDMVWTPYGAMIISIETGAYSEDRHSLEQFKDGTGWITLEEYEAWVAELEKEREAKDSI